MAEIMVRNAKLKKKIKDVSTQTGDIYGFFLCLTNTKRAHLYWSEKYNHYVLCFNFQNSKKFIITKQMWKRLKPYLNTINTVFSQ